VLRGSYQQSVEGWLSLLQYHNTADDFPDPFRYARIFANYVHGLHGPWNLSSTFEHICDDNFYTTDYTQMLLPDFGETV